MSACLRCSLAHRVKVFCWILFHSASAFRSLSALAMASSASTTTKGSLSSLSSSLGRLASLPRRARKLSAGEESLLLFSRNPILGLNGVLLASEPERLDGRYPVPGRGLALRCIFIQIRFSRSLSRSGQAGAGQASASSAAASAWKSTRVCLTLISLRRIFLLTFYLNRWRVRTCDVDLV